MTEITNTYSSGGGGFYLEHKIAAYYLIQMLVGDSPRGISSGKISKISFQQRGNGFDVDDIVITTKTEDSENILALQIKKNITFSDAESNLEFKKVITECWNTFTKYFDPTSKNAIKVGIAIEVTTRDNKTHLQTLLNIAIHSNNESEFIQQLNTRRSVSQKVRKYFQIFKSLLYQIQPDVSDEKMWLFLQNFVVLNFDIENDQGESYKYSIRLLGECLEDRTDRNIKLIYSHLQDLVFQYSISGRSTTLSTLRETIGKVAKLSNYHNFLDLSHLYRHSQDNIERIVDTISENFCLIRHNLMISLHDSIVQNKLTIIHGEPLTGKSVLIKRLAQKLRETGDVIFLSSTQLYGKNLSEFLLNLKIDSTIEDILQNVNNDKEHCIFIDGLDNINNDNKQIIINDLIRAVNNFNKDQQFSWKIICSCRTLDMENIIQHMETRTFLMRDDFKSIEIKELTFKEISSILDHIPNFDFSNFQEQDQILYRPGILSLLTLPKVNLQNSFDKHMTYSVIVQSLWNEIVKLAHGQRTGTGNPEKRENILIDFVKQLLERNESFPLDNEYTDEINGLISDRILVKRDTLLEFAHDAYRDWSLLKLIQHNSNKLNKFLKNNNLNTILLYAFRLYGSTLLEVELDPLKWQKTFNQLKNDTELSPKWIQTFESSLALSSPLKHHLQNFRSFLLENKNTYLKNTIRSMQTFGVRSDFTLLNTLFGENSSSTEKYNRYFTTPLKEQWIPLIEFILNNSENIHDECLEEISEFFMDAMIKNIGDIELQRKIFKFCIYYLKNKFLLRSFNCSSISYDMIIKIKKNLVLATIYGLRSSPDETKKFIKTYVISNRDNNNYGFTDEILDRGWMPLCKLAPNFSVSLFTSLFCIDNQDKFTSFSDYDLAQNYGLNHNFKFLTPTYMKGPFLALLRCSRKHGIQLIQNIANHSIKYWRFMQKQNLVIPIPQKTEFRDFSLQTWGNEQVYYWYRYPSTAPHVLTCALMALEHWLSEEISKISNPELLFLEILKNTCSATIVGVCVSVALKNKEKCKDIIIPILSNPVFWRLDYVRHIHDQQSEKIIKATDIFGLLKPETKIVLDCAREKHRKEYLFDLIPYIFFNSEPQIKSHLQENVQKFKDNLAFIFEHEKVNEQKQILTEACNTWIEYGLMKNYTISKDENGYEFITFTGKLKISERQRQLDVKSETNARLKKFCDIGLHILNKKKPTFDELDLENILERTLEIYASIPNINNDKKVSIEEINKLNSVSAVLSGLVICKWQWLSTQGEHIKCKKILLDITTILSPLESQPNILKEELFSRSLARCMPHLLVHFPKEKSIIRHIMNYSLDYRDEVRAFLFDNLRIHWTKNEKIIWTSIDKLLQQLGTSRGKIKNFESDTVNVNNIMSILAVIPPDLNLDVIKSKSKLLKLIIAFLEFTINAFITHEQGNYQYNQWSANNWNRVFFIRFIGVLISSDKFDYKLFEPIIKNWEEIPSLIDSFLIWLITATPKPNVEDRFITIWKKIADEVLNSDFSVIATNHSLTYVQRNIISGLLFVNPYVEMKQNEKITFIPKIIDYVERWYEKFATHEECFPIFLKFLKYHGFELLSEYGIMWIYNVFVKTNNRFLDKPDIVNYISHILWDFYISTDHEFIDKQQNFEHLSYIVDRLANTGDKLALTLQQKLIQ